MAVDDSNPSHRYSRRKAKSFIRGLSGGLGSGSDCVGALGAMIWFASSIMWSLTGPCGNAEKSETKVIFSKEENAEPPDGSYHIGHLLTFAMGIDDREKKFDVQQIPDGI